MSFIIENQADQAYINKVLQESKILKSYKIDWTIEEVIRFANILKIDQPLAPIIRTYKIDGEKLFDIPYLSANLEAMINETNFLPMYKLFYVVNSIIKLE